MGKLYKRKLKPIGVVKGYTNNKIEILVLTEIKVKFKNKI